MNHATTYHIGNNKNTRRKTATAVEQATLRVFKMDGTDKGCAGNPKRQTPICTDSHASNGFLKTTFLPKLKTDNSLQAGQEAGKLERDFYKSLSNLAKHYGIEILETKHLSYPYNIALSLWDAKTKLKNKVNHLENVQLIKEKKKTFLMTKESCNVGLTLYYIPVIPLFSMLKDKRRNKTAQLLLSVCSYLYHIVDVPYFRQEDSYLYWQYEMMSDWIEQDEVDVDDQNCKDELKHAECIGDLVEQKIYNRKTLTVFEKRLTHFKALDEFDTECLKMAKEAFELYTQYPAESIFRNAKPLHDDNNDYDAYEQECIPMEKYISFWADSDGWLSESLSECINNEFNEYGDVQEPQISKRFDGSPLSGNNLNFENRLFNVLDELIYLLNTYKKEKNGHIN
ncbi:hypothetical protein A0O34_21510 [Chryseobacterium glaciei]|uniref:Uncharacterized protein n=1 Tax=Chryseobacterium glaciei TaxID=1685010 RepID=A0A172Y1B7_9FLAO|nr:hypothetical protein [Chryseobacterium glaciei]ANF52940.1 hypothetical protein A0O34_21510 [Chryseobacterium glaciei]